MFQATRFILASSAVLIFTIQALAHPLTPPALVRHAPILSGTLDGSLQMFLGEDLVLDSGAAITGDLYAPGIPTLVQKGTPSFQGTIVGKGKPVPQDYQIALNGKARLSHLYSRVDAPALPLVTPPPPPRGKRSLTLVSPGQSTESFTSIRNLKLESPVGQREIPPGTYGDFVATGGAGFTLGIAGSTKPSVYNFQSLELGSGKILVVGPVILNVAKGFACNQIGNAEKNPLWLTLNIAEGNFNVCCGGEVYGRVNIPNGTIVLNDQSRLIGQIACDHLVIEGNGLLRIQLGQKADPAFRQASIQSGKY